MSEPNPTTVGALVADWASQTQRSFIGRLGGDVLLHLAADEPGADEWRYLTTARTPGGAPRAQLSPETRVFILKPRPDRPGEGHVILAGRAEANDIWIDHPSVSKLHARFLLPGPVLVDMGSHNGTFVDDTLLPAGQERALHSGDRIELGDCHLQFFTAARFYMILGGIA